MLPIRHEPRAGDSLGSVYFEAFDLHALHTRERHGPWEVLSCNGRILGVRFHLMKDDADATD